MPLNLAASSAVQIDYSGRDVPGTGAQVDLACFATGSCSPLAAAAAVGAFAREGGWMPGL